MRQRWGEAGAAGTPSLRLVADGSLLRRQPLLQAGPSGGGPRCRADPRHAGVHPGKGDALDRWVLLWLLKAELRGPRFPQGQA